MPQSVTRPADLRVVLANPPAYGGHDYQHELARHLARLGVDVEFVTSHFRFGEEHEPDGYRRREVFYPLSSRLFRRSPLRLPIKVVEHPLGMAYLALRKPDVVHMQWLALPELDRFFRFRAPSVFTAHDPVPRRAGRNLARWRDLLRRFDRIVAHTTRGRDELVGIGIPRERIRVIFHPVHPSYADRRDDGRTLLCFGLIREYKGIGDAIEAVKRVGGTRLLVAGDPIDPIDEWRRQGGDRVEWRLGYLPEAEVERVYAESTVALFPYRPELDQSGALVRALGAGVPAIAYDVGGLGEPIREFGAGRVVPPGDIDALAAAIRELLDDPAALEAAREGARRAREAMTWEASARAHLELYRELARS